MKTHYYTYKNNFSAFSGFNIVFKHPRLRGSLSLSSARDERMSSPFPFFCLPARLTQTIVRTTAIEAVVSLRMRLPLRDKGGNRLRFVKSGSFSSRDCSSRRGWSGLALSVTSKSDFSSNSMASRTTTIVPDGGVREVRYEVLREACWVGYTGRPPSRPRTSIR